MQGYALSTWYAQFQVCWLLFVFIYKTQRTQRRQRSAWIFAANVWRHNSLGYPLYTVYVPALQKCYCSCGLNYKNNFRGSSQTARSAWWRSSNSILDSGASHFPYCYKIGVFDTLALGLEEKSKSKSVFKSCLTAGHALSTWLHHVCLCHLQKVESPRLAVLHQCHHTQTHSLSPSPSLSYGL